MTHHTPMKDKDYDLVSTLYHALQGIETTDTYLRDVEGEDKEVQSFLQDTQQKYREISEKAKELLAARMG